MDTNLSTSYHHSLTGYTLQLLQKSNIITIQDFLCTDINKLIRITNYEEKELTEIRSDLVTLLKGQSSDNTATTTVDDESIRSGIEGCF